MQRKVKLTSERKRWLGKRSTSIKGSPLRPSISEGVRYKRDVDSLVDAMVNDVEKEIANALASESASGFAQDASITALFISIMARMNKKWLKIFNNKVPGIVGRMVGQADKRSQSTLKASLSKITGGQEVNTSLKSGKVGEVLKAVTHENVSLIKTVKDNYMSQVEEGLLRSVSGESAGGLKEFQQGIDFVLKDQYKKTKNKAKNISLDQTRKTYNKVTRIRSRKAGIRKFIWKHGGGGQKPDPDHVAMDGDTYSYDDPPVINKRTGEAGFPGDRINCTCFEIPIIDFSDGEEV